MPEPEQPKAGWSGHAPLRGHAPNKSEEPGHAAARDHITPPKPRRRWSGKRTIWLLAGLLVLAVVAVIFLPELLPGAAVRREVQAALEERLGRPVSIDSASFHWARA